MEEYEVVTKTKRRKATFLTKGFNHKSVLRNLINHSHDFDYINEHMEDKETMYIKIKLLK